MKTEKRLIDANALKERAIRVSTVKEHCYMKAVGTNEIDKAPTVDAVEVVHGRWIMLDPDRHGNRKPCCSVCHTYKLMAWSDHSRCNYCPNCGAKMDRGNENG